MFGVTPVGVVVTEGDGPVEDLGDRKGRLTPITLTCVGGQQCSHRTCDIHRAPSERNWLPSAYRPNILYGSCPRKEINSSTEKLE